ncbi:MAG: hypothetical protein HY587_06385 [Candidatus Omnitrophica bacterium]|nr:hypothetical protein [Candidatus Omnitrophota bacterium]
MIPRPERGLRMNAWVSALLAFSVMFVTYFYRNDEISWTFIAAWFVLIFVLLASSLHAIADELDEIRKHTK